MGVLEEIAHAVRAAVTRPLVDLTQRLVDETISDIQGSIGESLAMRSQQISELSADLCNLSARVSELERDPAGLNRTKLGERMSNTKYPNRCIIASREPFMLTTYDLTENEAAEPRISAVYALGKAATVVGIRWEQRLYAGTNISVPPILSLLVVIDGQEGVFSVRPDEIGPCVE